MRKHVVIGCVDLTAPHPAGQRGAVLDDQRIGRHVVDAGGERRVERAQQIVVGLPGVP